jgi:hypothetical protein
MKLSESYIKRMKSLSGLLKEEAVNLNADGGRSPQGTLGYYVEEYLLNIASTFVSKLDEKVNSISNTLILLQNETKLENNNVFFSFKIKEKNQKFSVVLTTNLEDSARTSLTILYQKTDTKYDLSSKYSKSDLDLFIDDTVNSIINLIKISN